MDLGKKIHLHRIFAHASGRLCSVALDHFIACGNTLSDVPGLLAKVVDGDPDAVTLQKGMAKNAWGPYAGRVPLIINSLSFTPDDRVLDQIARPGDVLRLGGDAIAVAIGVRGPNESRYIKILADIVEEADRLGLPVMAHIYPRDFSGEPRIVHDPDNILWAVRCGVECGADVIKVPFTGDADSYRQIVATSPVPVVAAGGPKMETLEDALEMMRGVISSGARGATIGRNIWGSSDPKAALLAFKSVIHGESEPDIVPVHR